MSASLVGSEMCIRDRLPSAPPNCVGPRTAPEISRERCGAPGELPGDPVSYTHLTLPTICSV
eukprot:4966828-Alexandrium_andersonii.AAC.1